MGRIIAEIWGNRNCVATIDQCCNYGHNKCRLFQCFFHCITIDSFGQCRVNTYSKILKISMIHAQIWQSVRE